ncbi:hypothetical protein HYW76_03105 [Candidatus Pacearchaeota archaeon]|nr:hypothetical protein [Candidatus Pacearchaeota archaeon]
MKNKRSEQVRALSIIANLVLSIVAFSFILGMSGEVVSGMPAMTEIATGGKSLTGARYIPDSITLTVPADKVSETNLLLNSITSKSSDTLSSVGRQVKFSQLGTKNLQELKAMRDLSQIKGVGGTEELASAIENIQYNKFIESNYQLRWVKQGEFIDHANTLKVISNEPGAFGTNQQVLTVQDTVTGKSYTIRGPESMTVGEASKTNLADVPTSATLGWNPGYFWGHVIQGLMWAGIAVGAIQMIGNLFGFEQQSINAASMAAFAGIMIGKGAWGLGQYINGGTLQFGFSSAWAWGSVLGGGVVALLVFEFMYKEQAKKVVSFECQPWQPPIGGKDCEKCNNEIYPCSEYRCRSLGQACQLLNAGTGKEKCAWVNPKDVNSPVMQPWTEPLSEGYKYTPNDVIRPPDRGVKIINNKATDGCVKAFFPLSFGITTNEPAQCKVDYNRTMKYDDMQYYFGGSSIYDYNHSQIMRLPSPNSMTAEIPEIKNDGKFNLYVRCRDANGNENNDLFVFSFCVEKGPDVTPAKIEATSISNSMPVQYGLNKTELEVYLNEPADCRWSRTDTDYKTMENQMSCSSSVFEMNNQMLYNCKTTLGGIRDRQENVYYFRCLDQPALGSSLDRNPNMESYQFILKGTQPLNIIDVKPNETITGTGTSAPVYLQLTTDNGNNLGDARCYYSNTTNEADYIKFYETGTNKHTQRLDLGTGNYKFYFQCVDLGGNAAKSNATFRVVMDNNPPLVVRVYKDGTNLKVITNKKSICSYSISNERECNFDILEGTNMPYANSTEHSIDWQTTRKVYIKCADQNNNQPLPTECSIVVKPYD